MNDVQGAAPTPPNFGARFAPLWNPPVASTRGRPPRVSRAEVVDAAVAIADADGLGAVSMRSVAKSLGVGTMTLYSHVPGRDELVDAMIDRAYADLDIPAPGGHWRPALEHYARSYWELLRTHRWLLEVNIWRLPLAPHVLAADEAAFGCLIDTGLEPAQVVETLAVVNNMVLGLASSAAAEEADESKHGVDYSTYWAGTGEFWETTFDPARFPTMTRLWAAGAFDAGSTPFALSLDSLLTTIDMLVARAKESGGAAIPSFDDYMSTVKDDGTS